MSERSDGSLRRALDCQRKYLAVLEEQYTKRIEPTRAYVAALEAELLRRDGAYATQVVTQTTWDKGEWTDRAPLDR